MVQSSKLSNLATTSSDLASHTVTFYNTNIEKKIHSYDCVDYLFKTEEIIFLNNKVRIMTSTSSGMEYMYISDIVKITGRTKPTVYSYFCKLMENVMYSKVQIKKGNGGRPAKIRNVEHVNQNLIRFTEAKRYIQKAIDQSIKQLAKKKSHSFRNIK